MPDLSKWYSGLMAIGFIAACLHAEPVNAQRTMPNLNPPKIEILAGNSGMPYLQVQPYLYPRTNRRFVLPEYGTEYQIRLSVPGMVSQSFGERYLFDIEVDGLSVMTGRPSFGRPGGYVVESGRSMVLSGWRINDNQVRKFVVAPPRESLAASNGNLSNAGRIRVRMYRELRQNSFMNIPQSPSGTIGQSFAPAGTAQGETVSSRVRRVDFDTDLQSMVEVNFVYSVASSTPTEKKVVDLPNATLK